MGFFSDMKNWIIAGLGFVLALILAVFTGQRKGRKTAEEASKQQAELESSQRREAAAEAKVEASEVRREEEQKTQKGGADAARDNLRDRWTRP